LGALNTIANSAQDYQALTAPARPAARAPRGRPALPQIGNGKKPRGKTLVLEGGKRRRAKAGASDGRRKRATIVAEVMKKRGLSMIEASKVVKKEGLY